MERSEGAGPGEDALPAEPGTGAEEGTRPGARWWELLAGTLGIVSLWIGTTAVTLLVLVVVLDGFPSSAGGETVLGLGLIALVLPITLLVSRVVHQRGGVLSSREGRFRWRWARTCTLLAGGYVVLLVLLASVTEPGAAGEVGEFVGWEAFLPLLLALALLAPLQSAAEEYLFRGWLQQTVIAWTGVPALSVAAQATLFALAHGLDTLAGFLSLVLFGAVTGVLTLRTGGIEAAVMLHAVSNLAVFALGAAFGMLEPEASAANATTTFALTEAVVVLLYAGAVTWAWRRTSGTRPVAATLTP